MSILVWSYLEEYEAERDDILDAVDSVFRSGQLVFGSSLRAFEQEFAAFCETDHAVGVDNGTNAIVLGLEALGIRPGDEVITVSNTAAPTVVAIDQIGARAVFVDIDPATYLMDATQVRAAITDRTRCLLPVHLFGQCAHMAPLLALADEHGLMVFEDCAQAHGARHHGKRVGSMGHAAGFSFYPTKVLGAYGDGGATVTSDDRVAANLRRLRYYGMEDRYYVVDTPGHNARLDEVHAEILRRKLRRIDAYLAARRAVAARYDEQLAGTGLVLPVIAEGNDHVYYLYVARHPDRDRILRDLTARGIELNVSYRWPIHTMTGFAHLGYRPGSLPHTELAADEIFSLPMYPSLPEATQERVCVALRSVLGV